MRLPFTSDTILKPGYVIQHYQEVNRTSFYVSTVHIVKHGGVITTDGYEVQNIDIAFYQVPTIPVYGMPENRDIAIVILVGIIIFLLSFILLH